MSEGLLFPPIIQRVSGGWVQHYSMPNDPTTTADVTTTASADYYFVNEDDWKSARNGDQLFEVKGTTSGKVPHKCPCCDGWGKRTTAINGNLVPINYETCFACNGTGIIWGEA